jgi:hypothetical protein
VYEDKKAMPSRKSQAAFWREPFAAATPPDQAAAASGGRPGAGNLRGFYIKNKNILAPGHKKGPAFPRAGPKTMMT